tara:strand:- start:755 stop:1066 length:312 start_codon:yes stop_codon:yes gene_type:complete
MTRSTNYRRLSIYEDDALNTANVVNGILDGKINSTGSITLTNSSTTTTLSDDRIGGDSVILFMPTTSDASSVNIHVTGRQKGQATLNHASATTTRSFDYVILG